MFYDSFVENFEAQTWIADNLEIYDHIGVETAGSTCFWGTFSQLEEFQTNLYLSMVLDAGEHLMIRLEDIRNINGAWPVGG